MDEIAHTGAVRRIVVRTVNPHAVAFTNSNLARDFDKVGGIRRALAGSPLWVGSRHIEVAQDTVVKARDCRYVSNHAFDEELRPSIGIDRIEERGFRYWRLYVHRLLCHDQPGHGGNLRPCRGSLAAGAGSHSHP